MCKRRHIAVAMGIFRHCCLHECAHLAPLAVPVGVVVMRQMGIMVHAGGVSYAALIVHPVCAKVVMFLCRRKCWTTKTSSRQVGQLVCWRGPSGEPDSRVWLAGNRQDVSGEYLCTGQDLCINLMSGRRQLSEKATIGPSPGPGPGDGVV